MVTFDPWPHLENDTIVALSTPAGTGRHCGDKTVWFRCHSHVRCGFQGTDLLEAAANTLHVGWLKDGDQLVDEVVVGIFRAPKSYTTEDVVEISCHGSVFIPAAGTCTDDQTGSQDGKSR